MMSQRSIPVGAYILVFVKTMTENTLWAIGRHDIYIFTKGYMCVISDCIHRVNTRPGGRYDQYWNIHTINKYFEIAMENSNEQFELHFNMRMGLAPLCYEMIDKK